MLLCGLGSVRIVKNCDLGLENAFSRPRSQFFPMRTSQSANNIYVKFTFHIFRYYFSKTGNYINLIVALCARFFTWLSNCRFLSMFTPKRSILSLNGILMSFTVKLKE